MGSLFSDLEKRVSEAVDGLYGEAVCIEPRKAGRQLASAEDLSRPPTETWGVVDFNPVVAKPKDMGQYDGYQPTVSADRIIISFDDDKLPADTAPNDWIRLLDPDRKGLTFRIVRMDPDGLGRIVCACVPS